MTGFLRDVLDEADALGLAWWERLALILAAAILAVAGRRAWTAIRSIEWRVEPGTVADEFGVIEDRGAKEGGGPAGGENGDNG